MSQGDGRGTGTPAADPALAKLVCVTFGPLR